MHVHRFERIWLVASLVLILLFIGTVTYGAVGAGFGMVDDEGGQANPTDPAAGENFEEPGVYRGDGEDHYDVYVEAYQFAFSPGTNDPIEVPADSTVTFHVASRDVIHGFEVVGTNINTMAIPGQIAVVTVEFDEPATYGVVCNEYCGSAHHTMAGTLEVVPAAKFNSSAIASGDS